MNVPDLVNYVTELRSGNENDLELGNLKDIKSYIFSLINQAPIMLFMKGSPDEPRCGFSRKIVDILNSVEAKYSTFDILTDDNVRQGEFNLV